VPVPGPMGAARSYCPGGFDQMPSEPSVQPTTPVAAVNDTRAKGFSVPDCVSPDVVYGTEKVTDVAGELSVMEELSEVYTFADSSTSWLPSAWTETVAEPFGDATEEAAALPTNGAAAEGKGVQLLKVGG
jgi:hypothetical protein